MIPDQTKIHFTLCHFLVIIPFPPLVKFLHFLHSRIYVLYVAVVVSDLMHFKSGTMSFPVFHLIRTVSLKVQSSSFLTHDCSILTFFVLVWSVICWTAPLAKWSLLTCNSIVINNKLCRRPPQYAPAPCDLDLWPFVLESGVRVMYDVGCLCANFSLPRPLCSRLRPIVRDRQTDVRCQTASLLNAPV